MLVIFLVAWRQAPFEAEKAVFNFQQQDFAIRSAVFMIALKLVRKPLNDFSKTINFLIQVFEFLMELLVVFFDFLDATHQGKQLIAELYNLLPHRTNSLYTDR